MDAFSNLILDFDFPNYRQEDPEYDKNSRQAFWYSFLNSFIRGANTLAVQNSSTSSFEYMATFLNSDVLSEVAAFLTAGSLKDTSRSLSSQLSCKGLIAYITSTVKSTHLSSLQQNVIDQIKKKSIDGTVEALNKIEQEEDDVTVSDIANVVFFLLGEQLIATQQKTNIKV
jgi:hypothetical protein